MRRRTFQMTCYQKSPLFCSHSELVASVFVCYLIVPEVFYINLLFKKKKSMKLVNWRKRYAACEMCSYLSVWCKNISFDAIKWKRVTVLFKDASPGVVLQAASSSLLWERTKKEKLILCCLSVIMQPCRQLWSGLSRFRDVRFFSVFVCWDYFNSNSVIYIFFLYICVYTKTASLLFWIF